MKVAIMQPYLFPYLGYFQLINAVDVFVILDDVQYIKGGWINRNKILFNNEGVLFTISVKKDSYKKLINQRSYKFDNFSKEKEDFFKRIEIIYKKSPYFSEIMDKIYEIFNYSSSNVAEFNSNSIKIICSYLGIDTKLIISSQLDKKNYLSAKERINEICKVLGADYLINPMGGINLYPKNMFQEKGIIIKFLRMNDVKYPQFDGEFVPFLSIIDVLMFNSKDKINELLDEYEFI